MIPTIDLAKDSPETQAQLIKHALGSVGFFAVQNAGPSVEDVQAMFDQVGQVLLVLRPFPRLLKQRVVPSSLWTGYGRERKVFGWTKWFGLYETHVSSFGRR